MDTDANLLLAACGLYCGACYHYRASFYDEARLQHEATRRGRSVEGFTCRGCRSNKLYIHPGCTQCAIRACTDDKGISHCGLCTEFPCEWIQAFQNDGRLHHQGILSELRHLRDGNADQWLVEQSQRWQCECGEKYSWYEETCCKCGKVLGSNGTDPTLSAA